MWTRDSTSSSDRLLSTLFLCQLLELCPKIEGVVVQRPRVKHDWVGDFIGCRLQRRRGGHWYMKGTWEGKNMCVHDKGFKFPFNEPIDDPDPDVTTYGAFSE